MDFQLKLYTLLHQIGLWGSHPINCLSTYSISFITHSRIDEAKAISKASDRVNFENVANINSINTVSVRHLISGQERSVQNLPNLSIEIIERLNQITEQKVDGDAAQKAFWWLWRFYPEYLVKQKSDALLFPASRVIPDCPLHSYNSTVSAIVGAIPEDYEATAPEKHPYLLIFTFSPVQEFIKSSRKFLDFWAGSYLLHYLSAKLCWHIANEYGPDAVITPSLWSQEIIDALMLQKYPIFGDDFTNLHRSDPVSRFIDGSSTSLSTAGFPNVITAIVAGKEEAAELGKKLCEQLTKEWQGIAEKVRSHTRESVINFLNPENSENQAKIRELLRQLAIAEGISNSQQNNPNEDELRKWGTHKGNWQWRHLWEAQINHTWEPYWTAVPLGYPEQELSISESPGVPFNRNWIDNQEIVAPSRKDQPTPTDAENHAYTELNIGTWWANSQSRLAQAVNAVKNTRNWQIPAAPGERSTISGQFSAVHPGLRYGKHQESSDTPVKDLREGAGVSSGSMQLFWGLMALVYPGLFNGSEKLNALELTKRMAWQYGGVAESLGIPLESEEQLKNRVINLQLDQEDNQIINYQIIPISRKDIYYDRLIRFPNLSSIAAARFVRERLPLTRKYWRELAKLIQLELPDYRDKFGAKTRGKAFNIPQVDSFINPDDQTGQDYNGVMFSSKWLAEDMGVKKEQLTTLRRLVEEAHKECKFGESSPADWWVIIVADGDGMGKYVSGSKLKNYQEYIHNLFIDRSKPAFSDPEFERQFNNLLATRKRMGPATHVGLNRALLDFSNRIVPYLTEKRFCGKVVYSGGDDVFAVLPLADLPEYLLCLRAAWCGGKDPYQDKDGHNKDPNNIEFTSEGGYWQPKFQDEALCGLQNRPLFTMGEGATMSAGIVIAHKSVPLPTVLESLWSAEEDRAKEMRGATLLQPVWELLNIWELLASELTTTKVFQSFYRIIFGILTDYRIEIPAKDGFCFRVIYGGGNVLEASMKGDFLSNWWKFISDENPDKLAPVLYRLAEELPRHAALTLSDRLISKAAKVIIKSRDEPIPENTEKALYSWLNDWEDWAFSVFTIWQKQEESKEPEEPEEPQPIGCSIQDLAKLLRFSAFWLDKKAQQKSWAAEVK